MTDIEDSHDQGKRHLYMVELNLKADALFHFLNTQNLNRSRDSWDEDLGYGIHAWLGATFGDLAPNPFRIFSRNGVIRVLGYTPNSGEELENHARCFASPTAFSALSLPDLLTLKKMPVTWKPGQRMGFEILTCPVARNDSLEKDIFLQKGESMNWSEKLNRSDVYSEWLENQMRNAVKLETAKMDGFKLVRMLRRTQNTVSQNRQPHNIVRPQVLIRGVLIVQDGILFKDLLSRGIGRHKSFGYGMLLLRPA